MSNSVLHVNGRDLQVPAEIAHRVYRLIHEIVQSGNTETVVFDVNLNGEPGKFAILVNPATQATLFTNDVAAMSVPFYDANVAPLLDHYLKPYMDGSEES